MTLPPPPASDTRSAAWEPRRIAIIGGGAMGTSLAAILGRIVPVVVIEKSPDRAAAIERTGAIATGMIEASSRPRVARSIAEIASSGADLIFVATKTTAIPAVAAELGPLLPRLRPRPYVVSYQNGIEPGRQLMMLLRHPLVVRMVLNFAVTLDASGAAHITLNSPPHTIGSPDAADADACRAIAALLTRAGMTTRFEPDIEREVWSKGIINAAMNPVAALVNATVGEVMASPARRIVEALLVEGLTVAREEGLDLGADYLARALRFLDAAADHVPSMVQDIRCGRESEVGQLNRQILEHARRLGIPTPTHDVIDALIEAFDWKIYHRRMEPGGRSDAR
jgi:2-dehydropantoate 2-reductase